MVYYRDLVLGRGWDAGQSLEKTLISDCFSVLCIGICVDMSVRVDVCNVWIKKGERRAFFMYVYMYVKLMIQFFFQVQ